MNQHLLVNYDVDDENKSCILKSSTPAPPKAKAKACDCEIVLRRGVSKPKAFTCKAQGESVFCEQDITELDGIMLFLVQDITES